MKSADSENRPFLHKKESDNIEVVVSHRDNPHRTVSYQRTPEDEYGDAPSVAEMETINTINQISANPVTASSGCSLSKGHLLLLVVAVLYGSLNVTLRAIYKLKNPPSASALSTVRGWLAVLCFAPFLLYRKIHKPCNSPSQHDHHHVHVNAYSGENEQESVAVTTAVPNAGATRHPSNVDRGLERVRLCSVAMELALWNLGAQGLINVGLLFTPSARAAFLTELSVVITPVLSAMLGMPVHVNVWWACGLALMGVVLLSTSHDAENETTATTDGSNDLDSDENARLNFALGVGDFLCLGGAVCWSTYLVRLSAVGGAFPEVRLQATKTFFLAILYSLWCLAATHVTRQSQWIGWRDGVIAWILLLYSAAGPGTLADVLQQKAQATVAATVANIVLSCEPIFTAIFGRILLGEETKWMEKLGGACILTAAVVATRD